MKKALGILVCLMLVLFCAAALADPEIDNLKDVYTIQVNEELVLDNPAWSGGEVDQSYFSLNGNSRLEAVGDGKGKTHISSDTAGVYPLQAWIHVGEKPILKWVAIVVKDSAGAEPLPELSVDDQFYSSSDEKWYYRQESYTLNALLGAETHCTFRLCSTNAFYNYFKDFPVWSIRHVSGPEYKYTEKQGSWSRYEDESGKTHEEPLGDYSLYFSPAEGTEDAVYEVTVSWHGETLTRKLTVHPIVPETWSLSCNDGGESIERNFYAGGKQSIDISVDNYSYFRNILGNDPVLTLNRISGQDIGFEVSTYKGSFGYYEFVLNCAAVPLTAGDTQYNAVCTWGDKTQTVPVTIHVVVPASGVPMGITQKEDIVLRVGETYQIRKSDYVVLPAGWEQAEGKNFTRDWTLVNYEGGTFVEAEESGDVITLTALEPGYAGFKMDMYDEQNQCYEFKDAFVITVPDENGQLPEVRDITMITDWPQAAVVGESWSPTLWWWDEVPPGTWSMAVEHNGEFIAYFDEENPVSQIVFSEKGTYTLHCYLTDGIGRTAEKAVTATVSDPSPLVASDFKVLKIRRNGKADTDIWLQVNYAGGQKLADFHYKIFAKDENGAWFMTWEEDSQNPEVHFWIGEDGDHYFEATVSDGTTESTVLSRVIYLGEGSAATLVQEDGVWKAYENGSFVEKTGLVDFDGNRFYVVNGILDANASGLIYVEDQWVLLAGGMVQKDYNGLWNDPAYGWWLVRGGMIDLGYTGLWNDPNMGWWMIRNGNVAFDYVGLYNDASVGMWLINGGQIWSDYTGLWNDPNYGWQLVGGGAVAKDYNGLWDDPVYGWWLVKNGTIDFDYSGLYNDVNVGWWLIRDGQIDFGYTGLYNDVNVGWWLISGGQIDFGYTGLWNDPNYGWWLIDHGSLATYYSGLWNDPNYGWWLVSNGTIAFDYTGDVNEFDATWHIENGQLIF